MRPAVLTIYVAAVTFCLPDGLSCAGVAIISWLRGGAALIQGRTHPCASCGLPERKSTRSGPQPTGFNSGSDIKLDGAMARYLGIKATVDQRHSARPDLHYMTAGGRRRGTGRRHSVPSGSTGAWLT